MFPSSSSLIAVIGVVAFVATTRAAELRVPADYPTPQAAIDAAEDGDVVILAAGRWPRINLDGKAITVRSEDPSDPDIVAATIIDAKAGGAAVLMFRGERRDTIIEGLTITGGSASFGGGIAILGADPWVRDCVIIGNEATAEGGGIYASLSSALFERCRIEGNTAPRGGGAATFLTDWLVYERCVIVGNTATSDGGGLYHSAQFVRVNRCTIAGNTAGALGGGAAFDDGYGELLGTIVRDNTAGLGGGVSFFELGGRTVNSLIVRNSTTSGQSGALYGFNVQPLIRNSILRDNGAAPYNGFGVNLAVEYSNIEGGATGVGNIDADPLFIDPAANDFRLAPGSPSVDTGFNGWLPAYALDDFDGAPRIQDGTVDMGPFERAGAPPERSPVSGSLVVAIKNDFQILNGLDLPIFVYDEETGAWSEFLRNMPAFSITADAEERCFWVHTPEAWTLGRIPYDTRRFEEIAVMKYENDLSISISGMAVRDGVLYGTTPLPFGVQPIGLYEIDKQTAEVTLVHEFPPDFMVFDLHYDVPTDRMLLLSTTETFGESPLGIFEIDLETGAITEVQEWINENPFEEAAALQGLAVGAGRNWIFRSLINRLESWDSETLELVETLGLPDSYPGSEFGFVLSGLTWAPNVAASSCPEDVDGNGVVGFSDLLAVLGAWQQSGGAEDIDGDGVVGLGDLLAVLVAWGPCPV